MNSRLELGKALLMRQEKLQARQNVIERKRVEEDQRVYERDGNIVYVSGFERHVGQQEVQEFIEQHGKLVQFDFLSGKAANERGRGQQRGGQKQQQRTNQPYCFVKFENLAEAEAFVEKD